ncbi:MAG: hypothetical protein DRP70_11040 [Spirochaetes bacterium]|nr:MAG: hypothetical protein DRP70_11040 [Spirochaetota bacterium]
MTAHIPLLKKVNYYMHKKLSIRIFLILLVLLQPALLFAGNISWFTSYDMALEAARTAHKNIFVLITAPSWCGWCVKLEENVLSTRVFQNYVSENYIALKLLDKVDGQRNPELSRFEVGGFPTVLLYDAQGKYIRDSYTQNPDAMIDTLKANVHTAGRYRPPLNELQLPERYIQTDGNGEYVNNEDGSWTVSTSGEPIIYTLKRYDYKYLYLDHPSDSSVIVLSMSGNDAHLGKETNGEWGWIDLPNVRRIGGDDFYN